MDIEWTRIDFFSQSGPSQLMPTLYTTTGSPERGYQSVLTTSENNTDSAFFYRCNATVSSYSNFSGITVHVKVVGCCKMYRFNLFTHFQQLLLALVFRVSLPRLPLFLPVVSPVLPLLKTSVVRYLPPCLY